MAAVLFFLFLLDTLPRESVSVKERETPPALLGFAKLNLSSSSAVY